jgi:hypothetical protein
MWHALMTTHLYLLYGVASAATIGFAALSPLEHRSERIRMALVLGFGWAACNQFYFADTEFLNVLVDAFIIYVGGAMWLEHADRWKALIVVVSFIALAFHVIYQAALAGGLNIRYCYHAALNALFVCQLLAVSDMGFKRGLHLFTDMLRRSIVLRIAGMARVRP